MARTDNLDHFLTDVASAIKTKKSYPSTQKIPAEDFDTEISTIETGSTINNQNKTITQNGSYQADAGYTGLGTVTVNVVDPEYATNLALSDDILDLPYTPLEYIESSNGNQYINTGLKYTANTEVKTKMKWKNLVNNTFLFGCDYYAAGYWSSQLYCGYPDTFLGTMDTSTDYEMDFNTASHKFLINGTQRNFTFQYNATGTSYNILVLSRDSAYGTRPDFAANARLYYFKIIDTSTNKTLIDLIPVRRKSDNIVCCYDLVSDTYFTNQGSDSFIAGPAKT